MNDDTELTRENLEFFLLDLIPLTLHILESFFPRGVSIKLLSHFTKFKRLLSEEKDLS